MQNRTTRVPSGLRMLLAEDEPLIAIDTDDMLRALGVDDVVCVRSVAEGMKALDTSQFHAAVLDLRLGHDLSLPLAQRLASVNTPFGFLTGFQDNAIPPEFRGRPVVAKPFTQAELGALLLSLIEPA